MCLSGLIAGIWRFSRTKRYRLRRQTARSPYAGWMWGHHYAGLLFGFDRAELMRIARDAMPGVAISDAVWLEHYYDHYYHAVNRRAPFGQ